MNDRFQRSHCKMIEPSFYIVSFTMVERYFSTIALYDRLKENVSRLLKNYRCLLYLHTIVEVAFLTIPFVRPFNNIVFIVERSVQRCYFTIIQSSFLTSFNDSRALFSKISLDLLSQSLTDRFQRFPLTIDDRSSNRSHVRSWRVRSERCCFTIVNQYFLMDLFLRSLNLSLIHI